MRPFAGRHALFAAAFLVLPAAAARARVVSTPLWTDTMWNWWIQQSLQIRDIFWLVRLKPDDEFPAMFFKYGCDFQHPLFRLYAHYSQSFPRS